MRSFFDAVCPVSGAVLDGLKATRKIKIINGVAQAPPVQSSTFIAGVAPGLARDCCLWFPEF
jgi:hypothetical protein